MLNMYDMCTPLKINTEQNHGGLAQIMFLSKWVMAVGEPCFAPTTRQPFGSMSTLQKAEVAEFSKRKP